MLNDDTLPKIIQSNYRKYGDRRVALREKEFGIWKRYTWQDCYQNVKHFSLGLVSLGLQPKDKVAIIGDNGPQWLWAELATQAAGGIVVGIFTDCGSSEVQYMTEHSEARFIVARDQEQVDKFLSLKNELPNIEKVIYWDPKGLWDYDDPLMLSFDEVLNLGKDYEKRHSDAFEQNVNNGKGDDIGFLLYTSGTTSLPKGAMISYNSAITYALNWFIYNPPDMDSPYVSTIPPAWMAEQWHGVIIPMMSGASVNFPEAAATAESDQREMGPGFFAAPSRMWEVMARHIQAMIVDAGFGNRLMYNLGLSIGYKIADMEYEGKSPGLFWKVLRKLADWAVFRPLKDKHGLLKTKSTMQVGGFLSPTIFRFFRALDIKLVQGYGLTEGGLVCIHREGDIKYETVGEPCAGVQIRLTDEGETMIKSAMVFNGYWKDTKSTSEKLENGWFHTGDAGTFDDDGHFTVIDRVDDLMELVGGQKFSPSFIESRLRFSPYVKDVMSVGGKDKPFLTCLIDIDFENVSRWAERRKLNYTTLVDLSQKSEVYELIRKDVEKLNKKLPEAAKVRRFVNLHKEFDADEAELTRTRKVRRAYMETRYQDLIDALYGEALELELEAEVKYRDGRMGTIKTVVKVNHLD
ncbi:MAG: AMP-binding protein [Chloroflexota bacterium]|nr:AMP-binding protein [Chloroflexota bacterium]